MIEHVTALTPQAGGETELGADVSTELFIAQILCLAPVVALRRERLGRGRPEKPALVGVHVAG